MACEVDEILMAETAVQDLLVELQELRKQVGGYDSAKLSLESARQSLDGLVEKTSALAERTHSATIMLGTIGTPEIIARSDSIKQTIVEFAADTAKQTPEIIAHSEDVKKVVIEFAADTAKRVKSVRNIAFAALLVSIFSLLALLAVLAELVLGKIS
jgi:hypothetical protein